MSWEYTEYTKPCACGKGLVLVSDGSNDWGQTSHHETILCLVCKDKTEFEVAAKAERKRIADKKIGLLLFYFKENYKDKLLNKFLNAKSKKAIWKIAHEIGLETYSESSFYQHSKSKIFSIEEYISSKIRWENLRNLINALEIDDPKLEKLFDEATSHIKEFEDEQKKLSYLWAKGKI